MALHRHPVSFFYVAWFLLAGAYPTFSQTACNAPGNHCMEAGTHSLCGGTLLDAGGGDPYPDDFIVMTICPDEPGSVVQLQFTAFSLQTSVNPANSDYLSFFDGPDVNSPSLGNYTGNALQGLSVTATVNNASGCLTLVFDPGGSDNVQSPGFSAFISCTSPCANPVAAYDYLDPYPPSPGSMVQACVGEPVSFQDMGSYAQPGFTLEQYFWNFGDGTIDSLSGTQVSHVFTEPGEYIVNLVVEDDNDCSSLNISPLPILVSTIPEFVGMSLNTLDYCFGQSITLDAGEVISPTWTELPPQVVSGQTFLEDGAGFSYSSSLTFDFFEDGAVITNCCEGADSDLLEIFVNMEHSFMGDLGITITCPNGTVVNLVNWPNGGGGTFLGEALDDDSSLPGVGYDYSWSPCATNGTWSDNAGGGILPAGSYESEGSLCGLIGCPLNGQWTLSVADNLAIDNGYIFGWGIEFNPSLIPGLTIFTPTIGADADSSYWTGPFITDQDAGLDVIQIDVENPGIYSYTYHVVNSFGCGNDTTIQVVVDLAPAVDAGPDQLFSCETLVLEGGFAELIQPSCNSASGTYTYCYSNGVNYSATYCPDDPGDGISAITIDFIQGSVEDFFDEFYVHDGSSTSAPLLAGYSWPLFGTLGGLSFTATNPEGCLTISVLPDASISCGSGFETTWIYQVGCAESLQYEWSWTPSTGLSVTDQPETTLNALSETTVFTLTGHPAGIPECAVSDQVVISVAADLEIDMPGPYVICPGDSVLVTAPAISGGTPPYSIQWEGPGGQSIAGQEFVSAPMVPSEYCVTVSDDCNVQRDSCVMVDLHPTIPATFTYNPKFGCDPLSVLMQSEFTDYDQVASMEWHFGDGDSAVAMGTANHTYHSEGFHLPALEITDIHGCVFRDTAEAPVHVWPTPMALFTMDPPVAELPVTTFDFINGTINGTDFEWSFGNFAQSTAVDTTYSFPPETPGNYLVRLVASSNFGCTDTTYRQAIIRDDIDIYIPNTFTPDGDGINDVWQITGRGFIFDDFHLQIFSRWGELIFETTDPLHAWNGGLMGQGAYAPDGVYLYRCHVRDRQYRVSHLYEGHIHLLR